MFRESQRRKIRDRSQPKIKLKLLLLGPMNSALSPPPPNFQISSLTFFRRRTFDACGIILSLCVFLVSQLRP